jgi:hypothetical protein
LSPQATEQRASNPTFEPDEELFRRYLASQLEDGELDPSAIRFNEPPSFLRSAYSVALDALHADCADGHEVSRFGVLAMPVRAVTQNHTSNDGNRFKFAPTHEPLPACYAHSEVHCSNSHDKNKEHVEPPKEVRKAFRVGVAKLLSVSVPAPVLR